MHNVAEKDSAEVVMRTVEGDLQRMTQRLTAKNEESATLMQEVEIMKTKIAITMSDTARSKEELREVESNIEKVKKSLAKYDPKYGPNGGNNPTNNNSNNGITNSQPRASQPKPSAPNADSDEACIIC